MDIYGLILSTQGLSEWSHQVLTANICTCMGLLKKGFMSLKAETRYPLSNKDWVQSKVSAACQVISHNTSSAHGDDQHCSESTHLLLMQQQQTQGCLQHHLLHVLVVHTTGFCISRNFCMSNTVTWNSPTVTQGTHNPLSAMLLIKAEFNFNQLMLDLCENSETSAPRDWGLKEMED